MKKIPQILILIQLIHLTYSYETSTNSLNKENDLSLMIENNFFLYKKMLEKNQTFEGKYLLKKHNNSYISRKQLLKKKSVNYNFLQTINLRNNCTNQFCLPPLGNLLVGRSNFLFASSTCGLNMPERFCVLGATSRHGFRDKFITYTENNVKKDSDCKICDSRDPFHPYDNPESHRIQNVIYNRKPNELEAKLKWWQAENGVQNVFIQFDLEDQFLLSNIYIHFKSFPPGALIIEKSNNYGTSWFQMAYFAQNCREQFPYINEKATPLEPFCTSKYSQVESRELIYRPMFGYYTNPRILNKSFRITNIRINMTQLQMFGDNHFTIFRDHNVMEKYFYSIREIRIMGTCFCNGHSSKCVPSENNIEYDREFKSHMVHSKCVCEHNTYGPNCEKCLPLYNDWKYPSEDDEYECKLCDCNNHAISCHYDKDLFLKNNFTSGGVCDNCMHNTEGLKCERCKQNFYHDKTLPISHPEACKPCKCDTIGSKNLECKSKDCECKLNVEGDGCNMCKKGYWNLSLSNGDLGCKECNCHVYGTINNMGCNNQTGECFSCKINVMGERCDKCKPGYYGLSEYYDDGCVNCKCSSGFSYSSECDPVTGQCNCLPNIRGKRCNIIDPGYFCANIDHLLYEAEDFILMNNLTQIHEKHENENDYLKWTGLGFVKTYEGGSIKFNINHEFETGVFDLVLRYKLEMFDQWNNIQVRVKNNGPNNPKYFNMNYFMYTNRTCYDLAPGQNRIEEIITEVNYYETGTVIFSSYCFEKHSNYEIEIKFNRQYKTNNFFYQSAKEAPFILIDSIVLIPDLTMICKEKNKNFCFKINRAKECKQKYYGLPKQSTAECDQLMCKSTVQLFGVLPCQCDPTGSKDNRCKFMGGQCACKSNIINRRCDSCKPSTWGFSENGCLSCNCDSYGSKDNICNVQTGQCDCKENSAGKTCDKCMVGFYNPPKCLKCQCNGFSEICTSEGKCINCLDNTDGFYCEKCKSGYYGSPSNGIPCKPCGCPTINGNNFAKDCSYDESTRSYKCDCLPGYTGKICEKCDLFHYGNPLEIKGSCKSCECNNNVNMTDPNSCDAQTGRCNNCLYNTHGFNCETCKPGYYGNALTHDCKSCNCNKFGTIDNSIQNCDSEFGHCLCLPNVIGKRCDECAQNFWNLESGEGCQACDCDLTGTRENTTYCDQKNGQCMCIIERGGRRCDECPFGYWGSPKTGCKKCMCTIQGSATQQCDRADGRCKCLSGVTGHHCDTCERGTIGQAPYCRKCGECFDNWDKILTNLNDDLEKIEKKAIYVYAGLLTNRNTNMTEFYNNFDRLNSKMNDIKLVINQNKTLTDKKLFNLNNELNLLKNKLEYTRTKLYTQINRTFEWESTHKIDIQHKRFHELNNETLRLLKIAVGYKESFINGAKDSILNSRSISEKASALLNDTTRLFETEYKTNLDMILDGIQIVKKKEKNYTHDSILILKAYEDFYQQYEPKLAELNLLFCGSKTLNCSNKCGGIVCDSCGYFNETFDSDSDNECSNGIKTGFMKIAHVKNSLRDFYDKKEGEIKKFLAKINTNKIKNKKINDEMIDLKENVNQTLNNFDLHTKIITDLISTSYKYTDKYQMSIASIESNCDYVLNSSLKYKDEDLDKNIELISVKMPEMRDRIEYIQADIESRSLDKIKNELNNQILNTDSIQPKVDMVVNETRQLNNLIDNITSISVKYKNLIESENNIEKKLMNVNFKLDKLADGEMTIKELIRNEEMLIKFNLNSNHEINLKSNINLVKEKLQFTIEKLNNLSSNTAKVMERIRNSMDKSSRENFLKLIQLQDKVLAKEKEFILKHKRLEELDKRNLMIEKRLRKLKQETFSLKQVALDARNKLKENNFRLRVCQ